MRLTNLQARQFLLSHHGLIGKYAFSGRDGIMSFIRRVGCIQYDPVDICGRNADIALNSRIKEYRREMLNELLYKDRSLIDYFDKNLSIFPVEDLPVFLNKKLGGGYAEAYDNRGGDAVKQIEPVIRQLIKERGYVSAKDVNINEKIEWHWSILTSLPRAALESMYFRGELIIHHKTGTNKSYAFMKDHISAKILNAPVPFKTEEERLAWHVKRRIGAVSMIWNKASDAWLGLHLKTAQRNAVFEKLLKDNKIFEVTVEGLNSPLYVREDDRALLEKTMSKKIFTPRTEFIAPLDSLIWDRKLIEALFGFSYKWEIYVPQKKRKYGAYTLPILHGSEFIGRIDMARKDKQLTINKIWTENGKRMTGEVKASFEECLRRFSLFNDR